MTTTKTHRHSAVTTSKARPFRARIKGARLDQRAHGGCEYTEACSCGSTRDVNASAGHYERGRWS